MSKTSASSDLFLLLGKKSTELTLSLHSLQQSLRRLDEHARGRQGDAGGDDALAALADANRTLAQLWNLAQELDLLSRYSECPRCQGNGEVTERGVVLRRVPCPDCGGNGFRLAAARAVRTAAPPRGRRQRFILIRLLALGGASWPVPLERLWNGRRPDRADRAALSRAVRDLEERGLLRRTHARVLSPRARVHRASHLHLTPVGAAVAQTLTMRPKR